MQDRQHRPFFFFLVSLVILLVGAAPAAGEDVLDITLNGERIRYEVSPYIDENNRTIVPVRIVAEELGSEVEWDADDRRVEIERDNKVIELWIDSKEARVNGEKTMLDTTAVIKSGRTMVPVRFVAETFGLDVSWDGDTNTVTLEAPEKPGDEPPPENDYPVTLIEGIAVVDVSVLNVREGPDENIYQVIDQIEEGTELALSGKSEEWFRVRIPEEDEKEGWIAGWLVDLREKEEIDEEPDKDEKDEKAREDEDEPAPPDDEEKRVPPDKEEEERTPPEDKDVEKTPPDEDIEELPGKLLAVPDSALVMKDTVNVRSGPGRDYNRKTQVQKGQWLEVVEERDSWYRVNYIEKGYKQEGWVAGWLVAPRFAAGDAEIVPREIDGIQNGEFIETWRGRPSSEEDGNLPLISSVEVKHAGGDVVIIINADEPLGSPHFYKLDRPSRKVFDFEAELLGEGEITPISVRKDSLPVREVRGAQFDEETARLVLELRSAASHSINLLNGGKEVEIRIQPPRTSGQTVVIDPGHGLINYWGSDPGAIGPSGLTEREVAMEMSLHLGELLQDKGISYILTRIGDTALDNSERAAVANIAGSEMLLSIHANAAYDSSVSGTMTFYHEPDEELEDQLEARKTLAEIMQEEMLRALRREDKGVRTANFTILSRAKVPSALVEVAFISNPKEEKLLGSSDFQKRAAKALAEAIERYLSRQKN